MVDVQKKPKTSYQFVVWIVLAVLAAALIAGCASQPAKTTSQPSKYLAGELPESVTSKADAPPPLVVSVYNYTMMQQEAARFFALSPDGTCTPRSLFAESLVEGPENVKDFYVLDVRGADDFAAGHIEGATNIPVWELFWPENLARLPKTKPILVACNSGTSASMATATLALMGYDAWQLRYGMGSWQDKTPTAVWSMNSTNVQIIKGGGYPVTSKTATPSQRAQVTGLPITGRVVTSEVPESVTSRGNVKPLVVSAYNYTVWQQAAVQFFALSPDGTCTPRSLYAESLVAGPENVKDFYVLDVRGADDFAAGHIEDATNIPVWELFWPENLARLPKDRPILVACNSGTSASMSTATLDLMGYDAWQLRYGMGSWQDKTPTAVWSMNAAYLQNIQGGSYPVVT